MSGKTINELVAIVHNGVVEKGFWEDERAFGELVALCHCELSEALEEYRSGYRPTETYYNGTKPEGIPTELADVVLRIMDMCGYYGIDLEQAIMRKMEYNASRPHKHGGKVI